MPLANFRRMVKKDVTKVRDILNPYYSRRADIYPVFTNNFVSTFLTKQNVVYSYVVETENNITDFISFFCINTHLLKGGGYSDLMVAYLYYYAPKDLGEDINRLKDLMMCALISARDVSEYLFSQILYSELIFIHTTSSSASMRLTASKLCRCQKYSQI